MKTFILPVALLSLITLGCGNTTDALTQSSTQAASPEALSNQYTVTKIYDGDTVTLQKPNRIEKVRIACIDAPELAQVPWGVMTKNQLASLIPVGSKVTMEIVERDRYDRAIGKIYDDNGEFVNLKLVANGGAAVYEEYLGACPNYSASLLAAEAAAKGSQLGVWSDSTFQLPWDWRAAQKAGNPDFQDKDCSDFASQSAAQEFFEAAGPGDPHKLDGNGDGLVCTSLK